MKKIMLYFGVVLGVIVRMTRSNGVNE